MNQLEPMMVAGAGKALPDRRVRVRVQGRVQGLGFRPFASRLATSLGLNGLVANTAGGVMIELEGQSTDINECLERLSTELPPLARLDRIVVEEVQATGEAGFSIEASPAIPEPTSSTTSATVELLPDLAPCQDCLADLFDPKNRRYRHAFISCSHCGPRFSIQQAIPFDRVNTSMHGFPMCKDCIAEYHGQGNRRFHAQTIACHACGPTLRLCNGAGETITRQDQALRAAAQAIRSGKIVALKAVGGFQLLVDARNAQSVELLRHRKRRPDKPFALMMPSLEAVRRICELSQTEEISLKSPAAPIMILWRRERLDQSPGLVADAVAPASPWLGVMLPSSPLHYLLMRELDFPVVATSGNLSDEPVITDEADALERLGGVADLFLIHDRPIVRALDDSVLRVVGGRALTLRLARGLAPMSVSHSAAGPPLLALGGHLKAAPAALLDDRIVLGAQIGNLDSLAARQALHHSMNSLCALHLLSPRAAAHDAHPDYYTSPAAKALTHRTVAVQHHVAHLASCLLDNALTAPVLGVTWDGSGYGTDGSVWGGEFIVIDEAGAHRVAHLRPFPLPGGAAAVREPRRSALGLLFELDGERALTNTSLPTIQSFSDAERTLIGQMLTQTINCPMTSSVGRLFDAVASLTGLVHRTSFEGQAAMRLEAVIGNRQAGHFETAAATRVLPKSVRPLVLDWEHLLRRLIDLQQAGEPAASLSLSLHHWLADQVVKVAKAVGHPRVLLTGGCFQNRYLTELAIGKLAHEGFEPHWHRQLPPNDGSLAVGQAMWAARVLAQKDAICV